MEEFEEIYKQTENRMLKTISALISELKTIRTGRASLSILDNVVIECYNSKMPISQLATLSIKDSKTIVIDPWDKNNLKDLEKGIIKSDIDISPVNNGKNIILNFPPLTEERRVGFVKKVKQKSENSKVSIRNIRRDANEEIRAFEKEEHIGKDEIKRACDNIQSITTKFINKIIKITEDKDTDLMKI